MKNGVFWVGTPCGYGSVRPLPVTSNIAPSSQILITLIMEVLISPETSVLTTTRRIIPEDSISYSHRRENLKSYIVLLLCSYILL
jgi:hypothetical protein